LPTAIITEGLGWRLGIKLAIYEAQGMYEKAFQMREEQAPDYAEKTGDIRGLAISLRGAGEYSSHFSENLLSFLNISGRQNVSCGHLEDDEELASCLSLQAITSLDMDDPSEALRLVKAAASTAREPVTWRRFAQP